MSTTYFFSIILESDNEDELAKAKQEVNARTRIEDGQTILQFCPNPEESWKWKDNHCYDISWDKPYTMSAVSYNGIPIEGLIKFSTSFKNVIFVFDSAADYWNDGYYFEIQNGNVLLYKKKEYDYGDYGTAENQDDEMACNENSTNNPLSDVSYYIADDGETGVQENNTFLDSTFDTSTADSYHILLTALRSHTLEEIMGGRE